MHAYGSVFVASCFSQGLDRTIQCKNVFLMVIQYKNVKIKLKRRSFFCMIQTLMESWFELFQLEFHHGNHQNYDSTIGLCFLM